MVLRIVSARGITYATATITFAGAPEFGKITSVWLGPTDIDHEIDHLNLIGDTAESIATCFALLINAGSTGVWAQANGAVLTITSRAMGSAGNGMSITVNTNTTDTTGLSAQVSGTLAGGADGKWLTDLTATPRMNRAARDWSLSFFAGAEGLRDRGDGVVQHGIRQRRRHRRYGIAQRYPDGSAAWLNTPALQTNFGPASTAFWQQVYADMAGLMAAGGSGTLSAVRRSPMVVLRGGAGVPGHAILRRLHDFGVSGGVWAGDGGDCEPECRARSAYPDECAFLPGLIGTFTQAVMAFVRQSQAGYAVRSAVSAGRERHAR